MTPTHHGSIRLFRFADIDVFLHWSWFIVAALELSIRGKNYGSLLWNAVEYLSLFVIVLLHEFGHSLACRQVGGRAEQIVLWPLGGVAYVSPPPRPGATLWSIAAGPLVNVALMPLFIIIWVLGGMLGWAETAPDLRRFSEVLLVVNTVLLGFNLLPIFPLDGGQILRSLLWYVVGRAQSLWIASLTGFVSLVVLLPVGWYLTGSLWIVVLGIFMLLNCWAGLMQARNLARAAKFERHEQYTCPECHTAPPKGDFWVCGSCRQAFDTFATRARCPRCQADYQVARCLECGGLFPIQQWQNAPPGTPPPLPPTLPR